MRKLMAWVRCLFRRESPVPLSDPDLPRLRREVDQARSEAFRVEAAARLALRKSES